MGGVSIWHWIVVGLIVLLLFGRGKISDMMGDVAKGIKAFKKGMTRGGGDRPPRRRPRRPRPIRCARSSISRRRRRSRRPPPHRSASARSADARRGSPAAAAPRTARGVEDRAMFDMSWGEVMVIGAVALIVIGPKDLPKALRTRRQHDRARSAHGGRVPGAVQRGDARGRARRRQEARSRAERSVSREHAASTRSRPSVTS